MNHDTPVNKDAALFLSRKRRVGDVQEALNKFAMAVCSPTTVAELRKIMRERVGTDESKRISITMSLGPDGKDRTKVCIIMATRIQIELGREVLNCLES